MFATFLLRYGLTLAIGVVAGLFVYQQYNEHRERPHERDTGQDWRTSDYREPHDPWGGPSSSGARSSRARSNSATKRRRRGDGARSQREIMIDELCAGIAECTICVEIIDAQEEVYHCRNCYNIFHLPCIQKWARTCSSERHAQWTCPFCNIGSSATPRSTCLCGQTMKPTPVPGLTPHCCTENCSRCKMPCHPGACDR